MRLYVCPRLSVCMYACTYLFIYFTYEGEQNFSDIRALFIAGLTEPFQNITSGINIKSGIERILDNEEIVCTLNKETIKKIKEKKFDFNKDFDFSR